MNSELFFDILYPILLAITTGLSVLIGYGFKSLFKYLDSLSNSITDEDTRKKVESIKVQAEEYIATAVVKVNQVLVDELKSAAQDKKLTKEEIAQAFNRAYRETKLLMGPEFLSELRSAVYEVDGWIQSKIEYYVNLSK